MLAHEHAQISVEEPVEALTGERPSPPAHLYDAVSARHPFPGRARSIPLPAPSAL